MENLLSYEEFLNENKMTDYYHKKAGDRHAFKAFKILHKNGAISKVKMNKDFNPDEKIIKKLYKQGIKGAKHYNKIPTHDKLDIAKAETEYKKYLDTIKK